MRHAAQPSSPGAAPRARPDVPEAGRQAQQLRIGAILAYCLRCRSSPVRRCGIGADNPFWSAGGPALPMYWWRTPCWVEHHHACRWSQRASPLLQPAPPAGRRRKAPGTSPVALLCNGQHPVRSASPSEGSDTGDRFPHGRFSVQYLQDIRAAPCPGNDVQWHAEVALRSSWDRRQPACHAARRFSAIARCPAPWRQMIRTTADRVPADHVTMISTGEAATVRKRFTIKKRLNVPN